MLWERWSRCVWLRLCIVLAILCVCVHLYVAFGGRGAPAPLTQKHPQQREQGRAVTRPARPAPGTEKRKVSYIRRPKTDPQVAKATLGDESVAEAFHQHRKLPRWRIELEPWASQSHSLEEEAKRFLGYITTPQVSCENLVPGDAMLEKAWRLCFDSKYSLAQRIRSKRCRVYSLGLGVEEKRLERALAQAGCEVHCFDPSIRQPHLQDSAMWFHRLSVDWRDPNPAILAPKQHGITKKLATILNDFGHREVDVLKVDMESAEWKILENLVLEGVLGSVGLLLLEVHLHWPGFEVGGDEPAVVRYWFSLLRELERAHFHLYHWYSDPAKPRVFLHKALLNASSTYTLGWVNVQWAPR